MYLCRLTVHLLSVFLSFFSFLLSFFLAFKQIKCWLILLAKTEVIEHVQLQTCNEVEGNLTNPTFLFAFCFSRWATRKAVFRGTAQLAGTLSSLNHRNTLVGESLAHLCSNGAWASQNHSESIKVSSCVTVTPFMSLYSLTSHTSTSSK